MRPRLPSPEKPGIRRCSAKPTCTFRSAELIAVFLIAYLRITYVTAPIPDGHSRPDVVGAFLKAFKLKVEILRRSMIYNTRATLNLSVACKS